MPILRHTVARVRRTGGPILRAVRRPIRRKLNRVPPPPRRPIVIATYHRGGSTLMGRVFEKLTREFEWSMARVPGRADELPAVDVAILQHGMCTVPLDDVVAVQIIRDPRDVVISGYDFHQRTREPWCTNVPDPSVAPVVFPQIDRSQEHRPEAWKRAYLEELGGRSYQEVLRSLPRSEGIQFEIDHYAGWTAEQMYEFRRQHPYVPTIRFEAIMSDFDGSFLRLFRLIGLGEEWLETAMRIARTEDISRRPTEQVQASAHTANRGVSRWDRELSARHLRVIEERYGDAIAALGYEPQTAQGPLAKRFA